jgi:hypothetical protein
VRESEPDQPFIPHGVVRPRFAFLDVSEVNVNFGDEIGVLECFQKFMDEDMWHLSQQRNIYANLFFAVHPNLKLRSRARSWMDKNPTEMKTLIGLLILQGVAHKPENGIYFSKSESIGTPYF